MHLYSFLCIKTFADNGTLTYSKWAAMGVTLRHSKVSPQRAHSANHLAFASFLRLLFHAAYIETFPYGTVPAVQGLNEHAIANT